MASRSLNKVILIGNLTRDPELRYTPSGTPVCSFGLATNRSWVPSGSDDRQEETEFHSIVAWSKLAELCAQLLTKGRKVYIEGRLQTRSWETPDGEKRMKTEVVAEDMIILDNRKTTEETEEVAKKDESSKEEQIKADVAPEAVEEMPAGDTQPAAEVAAAETKDTSTEAPAETEENIDITNIPF